jgi:hypothetical protein
MLIVNFVHYVIARAYGIAYFSSLANFPPDREHQ